MTYRMRFEVVIFFTSLSYHNIDVHTMTLETPRVLLLPQVEDLIVVIQNNRQQLEFLSEAFGPLR